MEPNLLQEPAETLYFPFAFDYPFVFCPIRVQSVPPFGKSEGHRLVGIFFKGQVGLVKPNFSSRQDGPVTFPLTLRVFSTDAVGTVYSLEKLCPALVLGQKDPLPHVVFYL